MFKYPLGVSVSNENNTYFRLTTKIFLRLLTTHINNSSSIALHLKIHSIPKSEFRKILVENTIVIAYEINKLRLQILEAVHIKAKKKNNKKQKKKSQELILKISTMF